MQETGLGRETETALHTQEIPREKQLGGGERKRGGGGGGRERGRGRAREGGRESGEASKGGRKRGGAGGGERGGVLSEPVIILDIFYGLNGMLSKAVTPWCCACASECSQLGKTRLPLADTAVQWEHMLDFRVQRKGLSLPETATHCLPTFKPIDPVCSLGLHTGLCNCSAHNLNCTTHNMQSAQTMQSSDSISMLLA